MRYNRRIRSLIADSGYDVSWTRMNGHAFHQYVDPASPYSGQDTYAPGTSDEFPWLSRGASIVFDISVDITRPLLLADNFRNFLLIQNNSFATSPDIPYNLYVSLDGPVVARFGTSNSASRYAYRLKPDVALLLDTRVHNNAIYVAFNDASGATATAQAVLTYGRTQNSPPLGPGAVQTPSQWTPAGSNANVEADLIGRRRLIGR